MEEQDVRKGAVQLFVTAVSAAVWTLAAKHPLLVLTVVGAAVGCVMMYRRFNYRREMP